MHLSESLVLGRRVAEKSPSHSPIYMCICMCKLCDLATIWNPKLVHGNTVSFAQTCRVELQRVTGLNLKLYCVTLTNRHTLHWINKMTHWLLPNTSLNMAPSCKVFPTQWVHNLSQHPWQQCQLWVKNNIRFTVNAERNPPNVILWAVLKETHFTDPRFFTGPVNGTSYPEMLSCAIKTTA